MDANKKRLDYLDVAKGIGMILVVMSHTTEKFQHYTDLVTGFFMPLFFIVSGFVYQDKGHPLGKSFLHRAKQLLFPYFIYSFVLYVIWLLKNINQFCVQQSAIALGGIIYSRYSMFPLNTLENTFFMIINNHPMWFLTAMYIASILSIIALKICKKSFWLYPFFLIVFMYVSKEMMSCPILLPWSVDTAFLGAFFIIMGHLLKKIFDLIDDKHWLKVFIFIPLIIMSVKLSQFNGCPNMSIRLYGNWGEKSLYYFAITGVMGSTVLILISQIIACTFVRKPFIKISKASVTVLAFHPLFLEWFDTTIGGKIYREPLSWQYWLYDYIKIVVVISICVLIKDTYSLILQYLKKMGMIKRK